MAPIADYFRTLLKNINPPADRLKVAKRLPEDVRSFLKDHSFETVAPHTRLTGSYFRDTAILEIKDVDVLLFLPEDQTARTPNAVLRDVKKALDEYPDARAEVSGQRRSVRLDLPDEGFQLDIVPAYAPNDTHDPLKVPDREQTKWIDSNPLGYADLLTELNQEHGAKVVPLVKLFKAWRDAQMANRKPKSYVLEAMVFYAVRDFDLKLAGRGWAAIVTDLFEHIWKKFKKLFEEGEGSPRIYDPGLVELERYPHPLITKGWSREHFETFMRRIDESRSWASAALAASTDERAHEKWKKVFGDHWPSEDSVKDYLKALGLSIQPGRAVVGSTGLVVGVGSPSVVSRPTRYHGN